MESSDVCIYLFTSIYLYLFERIKVWMWIRFTGMQNRLLCGSGWRRDIPVRRACKVLVPFASLALCETGSSASVWSENLEKNQLEDVDGCMYRGYRVAHQHFRNKVYFLLIAMEIMSLLTVLIKETVWIQSLSKELFLNSLCIE